MIFLNRPSLFSNADLSEQAVRDLSNTCKKRYDEWKTCKSASTFEACKITHLESYYTCVGKLNAIRLELDSRDRIAQKVN